MAMFIGTLEEFKKYMVAQCRNIVQNLTSAEKNNHNNICQYCGEKHELQVAHLNDKGKHFTHIANILEQNFAVGVNRYEIDLEKFEALFVDALNPFKYNFFFLCQHHYEDYIDGKISSEQILDNYLKFLINEIKSMTNHETKPVYRVQNTTYKKENKKISKSEALSLCRNTGLSIGEHNTFASVNKSSGNYWANPTFEKLKQDWWLILNNHKQNNLHVFMIPANSIDEKRLVSRNDNKNIIDLQHIFGSQEFEDGRGKSRYGHGVCFKRWLIKTIPY